MNNEEFLAYTAGFFDADGCVGVYGKKQPEYLRGRIFGLEIVICQKNWLPMFQKWHERWGGSLTPHPHTGWQWRLACRQAASFLRDILPYLQNKRDQAELAIEFQARKRQRGSTHLTDAEFEWQKAVSVALKEMKQTGGKAPVRWLERTRGQVAELYRQLSLFPSPHSNTLTMEE